MKNSKENEEQAATWLPEESDDYGKHTWCVVLQSTRHTAIGHKRDILFVQADEIRVSDAGALLCIAHYPNDPGTPLLITALAPGYWVSFYAVSDDTGEPCDIPGLKETVIDLPEDQS